MVDVIPFEKPEVTVTDLDVGASAVCHVPDCGWTARSDVKARTRRSAREHKTAHRTALGNGGGPQLTIFDELQEPS